MGSRKTTEEEDIIIPKKKFIVACLLIAILVASLMAYIIFRELQLSSLVEMGQFYRDHIRGYQLDNSWQLSKQQLRRQKKIIDRLLIQRGEHSITREQLGRQSWGILHMITTTAPDQISATMKEQFNALLMLFAKFYPCKLCANYFIRTLKKHGSFEGTTRMQMMDYMCSLHNRVNKRLGKSQFDCDMVTAKWGTCDCFSDNPINNIK